MSAFMRGRSRYFSSNNSSNNNVSSSQPAAISVANINKVFDSYRERTDPPDTIMINGTIAYFQALGLDLEELAVLGIAEALKSPTMGELSREGFVEGWKAMGCDTLQSMRLKIPTLRSSLLIDEALFKRVYLFTYTFALPSGQKSLPLDIAIAYWRLLLPKKFSLHLDTWVEFLEREYRKSIAKDTWNMLYDFVGYAKSDPELKSYDEEGAWPSILDGFVGYVRRRNGTFS